MFEVLPLLLFVCLCVWIPTLYVWTYTMVCKWRWWITFGSQFFPSVTRDWTQAARLTQQVLLLAGPSLCPRDFFVILILFLRIWVFCLHICMHTVCVCVCLVLTEARKGYQISWNWSYRQVWAAIWVLGIEPKSSRKAGSALNIWDLSPVPDIFLWCDLVTWAQNPSSNLSAIQVLWDLGVRIS